MCINIFNVFKIELDGLICLLFQKTALAATPDILVSTPACIRTCFSNSILQPKAVQDSLSMLVLDEVCIWRRK